MLTATPPRGAEVAITERVAMTPGRVDTARGIARNVKILGHDSGNGRRYTAACMRAAIGLYEGAKVNINHPDGDPLSPRSYADRFGQIRNVRYVEGRGLYGDLHFNPKHPMAAQFAHDAQHSPGSCGLSHNAQGQLGKAGADGVAVVDRLDRVIAVDIVADPATNTGLYESRQPPSDGLALIQEFQQLTAADDRGNSTCPVSGDEGPVATTRPKADDGLRMRIGMILGKSDLTAEEKLRRIGALVGSGGSQATTEHRHYAPPSSQDLIHFLRR